MVTYYYMLTEEINKVALSADDDKRIIMEDGISTLACGHYNAPPKVKIWPGIKQPYKVGKRGLC